MFLSSNIITSPRPVRSCPARVWMIGAMLVSLTWIPAAQAVPAFPGAEGFGASSVGGRGGSVLRVTTLLDSGPGSLRAAIEATGPRYVIFEVSGIINLQSTLRIGEPYITIAGESSPGGILITGRSFRINSHDVIIRHLRFRVGSHGVADGADPESLDALQILGQYWDSNEAHHVIIDHCSISWGVDENLSVTGGVTDTTIQWSLVGEGLADAGHPENDHNLGLLISGKYVYSSSVSLHHNYIANNYSRFPRIATPTGVSVTVDAVNNVAYNWRGRLCPNTAGLPNVNWIHNYSRPGPNSHAFSYEVRHSPDGTPQPILYVHGNIGATRTSQLDPHWNVGEGYTTTLLDSGWQRSSPWPVPPVTTTEMSDVYAEEILEQVGATRPVRDEVDTRMVNDFLNGTGEYPDDVSYPTDFPVFASPPAPADSDMDGMADAWEQTTFGDLSQGTNGDADGDGYENIEEYLHYLAGSEAPAPSTDGGVSHDSSTPSLDSEVSHDSSTPSLDSGVSHDSGALLEAGPQAGDLGSGGRTAQDGCRCDNQTTNSRSSWWSLCFLVLLGRVKWRRRRSVAPLYRVRDSR